MSFGIQQFVCPHEYVTHRAQETVAERHLRLARYYCKLGFGCWLGTMNNMTYLYLTGILVGCDASEYVCVV